MVTGWEFHQETQSGNLDFFILVSEVRLLQKFAI